MSLCTFRQRTVSCGPSYGSRAFFPDPLDIWVATYQKIRLEDEVQEDKVILILNFKINRINSHLTIDNDKTPTFN